MWTKTNTLEQLTNGIVRHGTQIIENCLISDDFKQYVDRVYDEHLNYPVPPTEIDHTQWYMPAEYRKMDIYGFLEQQCNTQEERIRLDQEYQEFERRDLVLLLKQMKYIVDTLRKNNIVWGVGRGSSVASLVLHLLGVHKINPIKYNIPIEEFFKEI